MFGDTMPAELDGPPVCDRCWPEHYPEGAEAQERLRKLWNMWVNAADQSRNQHEHVLDKIDHDARDADPARAARYKAEHRMLSSIAQSLLDVTTRADRVRRGYESPPEGRHGLSRGEYAEQAYIGMDAEVRHFASVLEEARAQ